MVSQASSASEWQDMLSGRLPMREVRAWGKRLAYDGMFRDTLHHIMTDGDSRMAENAAWVFTYADADVLPSPERNAPPPVAHAHQPFNAPPPVPHGFLGLLPCRDVFFPISS